MPSASQTNLIWLLIYIGVWMFYWILPRQCRHRCATRGVDRDVVGSIYLYVYARIRLKSTRHSQIALYVDVVTIRHPQLKAVINPESVHSRTHHWMRARLSRGTLNCFLYYFMWSIWENIPSATFTHPLGDATNTRIYMCDGMLMFQFRY